MATEIKLPRLGQGMESGTIVKWLKSEGDQVEKGEPLYELDTDKVTQEVEADASGVLLKIAVAEGEVEVGKTIAVIGEQGEKVEAATEQPSGNGDSAAQDAGDDAQEEGSPARAREQERERGRQASAEPGEVTELRESSADNGGRIKASPLARRIARERGIDLASVAGTGPDGRVVAEDVERTAAAGAPVQLTTTAEPTEGVEIQQLSSMRKTIARRLTEAWQAPVFQLGITVDMGRALELRERLVELHGDGVKPTINDLLTKVCAAALMRHREVNALYKGDAVELYPTANVGIAVAVPNGLVVPVIQSVERRSIAEIAAARAAVVERRASRQAPAGRPRRWNVHDLEPRHVRDRALHRRLEPASGCDPGRRVDRGQGRRGRRAAGGSPTDGADPHLRPSCRERRHRRRIPPRREGVPGRARPGVVTVWYHVRDLAAGRAFYKDKLGFTETYVDDEGKWVKLERNGMEIGLAEGEPEEDTGVAHVDVGDVKAVAEDLRNDGVEIGVVFELHGEMRLLDVFDPDGNRLQFAQELRDLRATAEQLYGGRPLN